MDDADLPYTEDLPTPKHHYSIQRVPVGSRTSLPRSIVSDASSIYSSLSLPSDGRASTAVYTKRQMPRSEAAQAVADRSQLNPVSNLKLTLRVIGSPYRFTCHTCWYWCYSMPLL